ncbi:hypothetical protein T492DRAFT_1030316 [Pavlovales sp. CCMP2436]|nr:hypothetical protein T492DRAFT_1030316 [Pavlovales sp. CCMP2436]
MSLLASLRPLGLRSTALVGQVGRLLPNQLGRAALSSTSVKPYAPLPDELDKAAVLALGDKHVFKALFQQATDRESAVAALEELERRLQPEQVLGFFSGTVVRFITLERYNDVVEALIGHLAPQILGKGFFSGFGSALVPQLIPTDLTSAQSRANATLPRPSTRRELILSLLGTWMVVFAPLIVAGVFSGFSPVESALGSGAVSSVIIAADFKFMRSTGRSLVINRMYVIMLLVSGLGRRRIAMHEAGHFFVAYAHGLPLSGYSLSSVINGVLTGDGGYVICRDLAGRPSDSLLLRVASLRMAGVAAECVYQGFSMPSCGGDLKQLDEILREHRPSWSAKQRAAYQTIALYDAYHLLRQHECIFRELAAAMERGASFARCCAVVADAFDAAGPDWAPTPPFLTHPYSSLSRRLAIPQLATAAASRRTRSAADRRKARRAEDSARADEPMSRRNKHVRMTS